MIAVWKEIVKHKGKNIVEESEGKEGLIDFVKRWHCASARGYQIIISPVEWIETPQQPDAVSCGVLDVAQAYSYLTESMRLQEHGVSKRDVSVMRLKMIWMVVWHSKKRSISVYDADKANRICELLQKQLG
ncbi:hypothetical protein F443_22508 [Phytophthora nicotianae P1569]|uniref:Ubiquitin-like protease family profile domain-containing protein n=2 Tax=Phytophthora nicotianae TaxID=4792 RepID=V9DU52_PHYNI|nr:hypothetical protein F443_22508 [Phytophthora nicotianae P1569]ETO59200.1 hypothetical protein F444_22426 [Phytophthora nicotianae P1976]